MPYLISHRHVEPILTAVIRSRVKKTDLSTVVPQQCGEVWNFCRATSMPKPGRMWLSIVTARSISKWASKSFSRLWGIIGWSVRPCLAVWSPAPFTWGTTVNWALLIRPSIIGAGSRISRSPGLVGKSMATGAMTRPRCEPMCSTS